MGHPYNWVSNIAQLELAFFNNVPENECIIHNACLDPPEYLKEIDYDLIILNSSFLGCVFNKKIYEKTITNYSFLSELTSYKVALPQDDYYCNEILNQLLIQFNIDLTITPLFDYKDLLHKAYINNGGELLKGYTGYITSELIDLTSERLNNFFRRKFDVIYRASNIPTLPNNLAMVKANLGDNFSTHFDNQRWKLNVNSKEFYYGNRWIDFLNNGRVILGSDSGSSEIILNHKTVEEINDYRVKHNYSDKEIIEKFFPDSLKDLNMTSLSPRNFEAGLTLTSQLLIPGEYGKILTPYEDYFPYTNSRKEVIEFINDKKLQYDIALNCREKLLSINELRIESFIEKILSRITISNKVNDRKFKNIKDMYNKEMSKLYLEYFTNFSFYKYDKAYCDWRNSIYPLKKKNYPWIPKKLLSATNILYRNYVERFIMTYIYGVIKYLLRRRIFRNKNYLVQ